MKRSVNRILIILIIIFPFYLTAQSVKIDSLKALLIGSTGRDRVDILNEIADNYRAVGSEETLEYSREAMQLSEKLDYARGLINSLNNIGIIEFNRSNIDQAESYFSRALTGAEKLQDQSYISRITNNLGLIKWRKGEYTVALEYYNNSIESKIKLKDQQGILNTKLNIGLISIDMGNYQKALDDFNQCREMSLEQKDEFNLAQSINYLGVTYMYMGDYHRSLEQMLLSLDLWQAQSNKRGLVNAYNNIAVVYFELENFEEALEYNEMALKIYEELGDKLSLSNTYNNLGSAYYNLKEYDKALEYHNHALELRREIGLELEIVNSLNNIGLVYEIREDLDKALKFYMESWEIYKRFDSKWNLANNSNNIGRIQTSLGNYDLAEKFLKEAQDLAGSIGAQKLLMENYQHYFQLYEVLGQYENSLEAYKNYSTIKDSIFSQESKEKIADLHARYELDKKEKENLLLKKDLKISLYHRNLYIFGLVGLVIILGILIIYFFHKAKITKQLEIVNQQLNIAKNTAEKQSDYLALINKMLRHDLANNFATIISGIRLFKKNSDPDLLTEMESKSQNSISLIRNIKKIALDSYGLNKLDEIELKNILTKIISEFPNVRITQTGESLVHADNTILSVFENLINNAIIHGEADQININIANYNEFCEIKVSNNGTDIPHDIADKIFDEKFASGEHARSGMGLYIARQIIQRFGGSIHVEDNHPQGATFVLNLRRVR